MTETSVIDRDVLIDAAECAGLESEDVRMDYSGRGMYGARCIGVVVEHSGQVHRFLTELESLGVDTDDMIDNTVEDGMGRRTIAYWPGVAATGDGE